VREAGKPCGSDFSRDAFDVQQENIATEVAPTRAWRIGQQIVLRGAAENYEVPVADQALPSINPSLRNRARICRASTAGSAEFPSRRNSGFSGTS
jgi:hypothetical protein